MSSSHEHTFETHDTHIFICCPRPNPFGFQLTFPLPLPSKSRVRSPVNACVICVPSPGFRSSVSPMEHVLFSPIDDMENSENWKFMRVRVTDRVRQLWFLHGQEKFLAGTFLYLYDAPQFGPFCEADVHHFMSSLGDEDYLQWSTGMTPNYTEADLKVLFLEASEGHHFLYARVRGAVKKFIFNRRRCRFELLRVQGNYDVALVDVNVSRRSDDVLMKVFNMTICRNKAGFLEKHVNGRQIRPSAIFLQRVNDECEEEDIQLPEDVEECLEEEESDEEEENDQTVYSDGDVPKVEHEEEVMAEEHDYFRLNQVVTDSSSDDDEDEFIVVD